MSEINPTIPKVTSPRAIARWPHLSKPDTKFNAAGVYRVTLALNPEEPAVAEFMAKLDDAGEKALELARQEIAKEKIPGKRKQRLDALALDPVYSEDYDQNTGEATGLILVKAKTYATKTDSKTGAVVENKITAVDANCQAVDLATIRIGNGTIMKVSGSLRLNYVPAMNKAYVSYYISAVQIISLVEYSGGGGANEFSAEDGDFLADSVEPKTAAGRSHYAEDLPNSNSNNESDIPF